GSDAFVRKYDSDGNEIWTRQFGTAGSDWALGLSVNASGVYVAGYTEGALSGQDYAGGGDAFLRMYDANGAEQRTREFGTSSTDGASAADASGIYVGGVTSGTLPGQASAGGIDAFLVKLAYPPTDITLSNNSVAENLPAGTVVGNLSTADPTLGDSPSYTLVSGTGSDDNASFQIVGNQLQTSAPFDFETKSSYTI